MKKRIREPGHTCIYKGRVYVYLLREDGKPYWRARARVVMEEQLGRTLARWELAHHIDEDQMNDDPRNLEIKISGDHTQHHLKGVPKSEEHRRKIGEGGRGRVHTPESRAKMREAWERRRQAAGTLRSRRRY